MEVRTAEARRVFSSPPPARKIRKKSFHCESNFKHSQRRVVQRWSFLWRRYDFCRSRLAD